MSDQFYDYLANKIVKNFEKSGVKAGDRFNVEFETPKKVKKLYDSLKSGKNVRELTIEHGSPYETFEIVFKDVDLIISATLDGVSPEYLVKLRNEVSESKNGFKNKAILFIIHENLDSISEGTLSLYDEGMPLNAEEIQKDIKNKTRKLQKKSDREIITYLVNNILQDNNIDNTSIFEYENILRVLNVDKIPLEEYKNFGLFIDEDLKSFENAKEIKDRLKSNFESFELVEYIHQYGNTDELNDYFEGDSVIKNLKKQDWKDLSFSEISRSRSEKEKKKIIKYIEPNIKKTQEGLIYWERAENEKTKAGRRKRNIIVFNPDSIGTATISFEFESLINQPLENKGNLELIKSGKKIKAKINCNGEVKWARFYYGKTAEKHDFRIVVLPISETMIDNIKSKYRINYQKKHIILDYFEDTLVFNEHDEIGDLTNTGINVELLNSEDMEYNLDKNITLQLKIDFKEINELNESIPFKLVHNDLKIPFSLNYDFKRPLEITGLKMWNLKREKQSNFTQYGEGYSIDNNKLIFDEKEYFAKKDLMEKLIFEKKLLEVGTPYMKHSDVLYSEKINISDKLERCYRQIVEYYNYHKLLPSGTYLTEELKKLYSNYLETYIAELNVVNRNDKVKVKDLLKLGVINDIKNENKILYTPLHPLNVAYQLKVAEEVNQDILDDNVLFSFGSDELLPFIYYDRYKLYKVAKQGYAPEWTEYVENKKYNESKAHISLLVKQKITEFIDHFKELLTLNDNIPLKINLIRMGDCKEVLRGIYEYYKSQLHDKRNKKTKDTLNPIEITIYDENKESTAFEKITYCRTPKEFLDMFGIELKSKEYTSEELLDILHSNIKIYRKYSWNDYNYSHLTFYGSDESLKSTSYEEMSKLNTGISLNGLISGITSKYIDNTYKTGFGSQYMPKEQNYLLDLALKLNTFVRISENDDPYEKDKVIVSTISEKKEELEKIYSASYWVTFVNPQVDLNFFKSEDNEIVIIHYSDQYTNSSGYDAITVTKKSEIYQNIIENFLNEKIPGNNLKNTSQHLINYFNAINGNWLLKMTLRQNEDPREKISILSAINVAMSYLDHEKIVWIPISLEELLRVSGGVGLSKKKGVFSAENIGIEGSCSDDILMLGIENTGSEVFVHVYPIEVKIGKNSGTVCRKAENQVLKTYDGLYSILSGDEFINKYYRNFLITVALMNLEKLMFYNIGNLSKWESLLDEDIRIKLLNDDYMVATHLENIIGKAGSIQFTKGIAFRDFKAPDDGVLTLKFTENDGYRILAESVDEVDENYFGADKDLGDRVILNYSYEPRIEEPRIEEPRIEEPRIEEPRIEEPRIEEPVGVITQILEELKKKIKSKTGENADINPGVSPKTEEEPRIEEPRIEEPRIEEPRIEEPRIEEPRIEEPRIEEPRIEEPRIEEPRI
ncbi:DNA phosphorothioation-dependent restriction protein DptH, partial [Methanococcus maripaludis]